MKQKIEQRVSQVLDTVDGTVLSTADRLNRLVDPARSTFAKRYPTLFSLLATAGVAMTFLGIEQLLLTSSLLERYPVLILAFGVGILALTGTLYKKLT
ncbi:MAG: hypothetical protein MUF19_01710 [Candidatus Pacebacteria bacterium]|jgi:hypothetical protein|nr:hypothetical protein [Candidatus Paceibacterota bacterium]